MVKNGLKVGMDVHGVKVWDSSGNAIPVHMINNVPWVKLRPINSLEQHHKAH